MLRIKKDPREHIENHKLLQYLKDVMVKFFRKIRQQLFREGNLRKYLAYAVGEIFLVVIGILLALQINNWNESRKANQQTNELFSRVQKELARNISNANETIGRYKAEHLDIYKLKNKTVNAQDYHDNPAIAYLIFGAYPTDIDDQAFNNLIDFQGEFSMEQDALISKMKTLYNVDKRLIEILNEQILANYFKYEEKLKNTQSWYGDYALYNGLTDKMIAYFLNDPFYFNEVVSYLSTNYGEHLTATIQFRTESLAIYQDLSDYLNLPKDTMIIKELSNFDHFVGIYNSPKDRSKLYQITKDKNRFIFSTRKNNTDSTLLSSFPFYPETKSSIVLKEGFGKFIFDDHQVTGLIYSTGAKRLELIKLD